MIGTARTRPETGARTGAEASGAPRKKELMMHILLAPPPNAPRAQGDFLSKAENILKTKVRKRAFSPAKADNILKIKLVI